MMKRRRPPPPCCRSTTTARDGARRRRQAPVVDDAAVARVGVDDDGGVDIAAALAARERKDKEKAAAAAAMLPIDDDAYVDDPTRRSGTSRVLHGRGYRQKVARRRHVRGRIIRPCLLSPKVDAPAGTERWLPRGPGGDAGLHRCRACRAAVPLGSSRTARRARRP